MTVYILAKTETGWLGERADTAQWEHLLVAFNIDGFWLQDTIDATLDTMTVSRVFLEPIENQPLIDNTFVNLVDFEHPIDCVYVFGNSASHNISLIRPEDSVVYLDTPNDSRGAFGVSIAAVVLYDRERKGL